MSHLGSLLDLPEGARLTGVGLQPLEELLPDPGSTAHLQLAILPETPEPSACSGALTAFLPEVFATMHGSTPDGGSWAAFLLLPHGGPLKILREGVALAPLRRAMNLLGLSGEAQRSVPLTQKALQWAYWQKKTSSVADWSMDDLLLGLLVELTDVPLLDAVDLAEGVESGGRRDHLMSLLESWAEW